MSTGFWDVGEDGKVLILNNPLYHSEGTNRFSSAQYLFGLLEIPPAVVEANGSNGDVVIRSVQPPTLALLQKTPLFRKAYGVPPLDESEEAAITQLSECCSSFTLCSDDYRIGTSYGNFTIKAVMKMDTTALLTLRLILD